MNMTVSHAHPDRKYSGFKKECELRDAIANMRLTDHHAVSDTYVRSEVPLGKVIPDVVYVSFTSHQYDSPWPRNWSHRHSHIIWLLKKTRKLSLKRLAQLSYDSETRISPFLNDLQLSGAVEQTPTGAFQLTEAIQAIEAVVVAVEAKLTRWKDALTQATHYLTFADESVVVMAQDSIPRDEKRLGLFQRSGIGLCAMSKGHLEWLVEPQRSEEKGAEWDYLVGSAARKRQTLWSAL